MDCKEEVKKDYKTEGFEELKRRIPCLTNRVTMPKRRLERIM